MKCVTKCPLNSLKVEAMFWVSLLNHTLADSFSLVGKTLHMISFATPCKCIRVLNDSRCSSESLDQSYVFTYGIRNFAGKEKEVTWAVNVESV